MPHKRAKHSLREKLKTQQGADMAPGRQNLTMEAIPKSFSRVINASKIREEWKAKKRKLDEAAHAPYAEKRRKLTTTEKKLTESADGKSKGKHSTSHLKIKPGESIQHFHRRVEDDMRPLVKAAMISSNAATRSARKAELDAKTEKKEQKIFNVKATVDGDNKATTKSTKKPIPPSLPVGDPHTSSRKEFAEHSSSAPRRLNDIAKAPPEFKNLPRRVAAGGIEGGKREGVLSMAQKSMMEQEREKVIARYRELRAQRKETEIGMA